MLRSLLLGMVVCFGLARAEVAIQSDTMRVVCDTNSSVISISRANGELLLRDVLTGDRTVVAARISPANHKVFGRGESLEITHANGNQDTFIVFPKVPFALVRPALSNRGDAALLTNKVPVFAGSVACLPGSNVTTFGTGGLLLPDKNPGSYAWMAVVEPETRHGLVCGWLTHDRGSGVFFSSVTGGVTHVSARIDYGRLRLVAGKTEELETLAIGYFTDARLGLEQWADAIAKMYDIHLPPQPTGYCTWYSRPHGGASDESHLAELAAFAKTNLAPFGFSVVQIDDGWQEGRSTNGPKRNFTTHRATGPYPHGMKAAADQIRSLDLVPGIWFMPFAGTYYDPFFASHQDWFVKRASDGKPYETAWGGTCLDMTHPGAREHLSETVRRIARDWGYGYIKIDGLWTGTATKQQYVNSGYREDNMGDALLHDPDKTNLEAYRDGLRLLRQAAGSNVFVLGCNGPQNMRSYGGAFGLVDGMRVGPDNGASWKSLTRGPAFGSRHYFLHRRVWYNDPDPVYVRADMPLQQAQLICSWVALSGQMNLSSEWLPGLPAERLEILKRTMPPHKLTARPADLFENDPPRLWLVSDPSVPSRRDVLGVFNWGNEELVVDYPLDRIGLDASAKYDSFDFWQNEFVPVTAGRLKLKVPPQSCRVLAFRAQAGHAQLISTSRHITQGMLDVIEEKWDDASNTLRGRSRLIAGDRYELRFGGGKAASVRLSEQDASVGAKAGIVAGDPSRVTIDSPVSREVSWQVSFQH